jgi:hypothetical protein
MSGKETKKRMRGEVWRRDETRRVMKGLGVSIVLKFVRKAAQRLPVLRGDTDSDFKV